MGVLLPLLLIDMIIFDFMCSPFLCVFGNDSVILYTRADDVICDVADV